MEFNASRGVEECSWRFCTRYAGEAVPVHALDCAVRRAAEWPFIAFDA